MTVAAASTHRRTGRRYGVATRYTTCQWRGNGSYAVLRFRVYAGVQPHGADPAHVQVPDEDPELFRTQTGVERISQMHGLVETGRK